MTRPEPITRDHEFYAAILDELRALNAHFGGGAEPSGPAVADGLTVTEQSTSDTCRAITVKGDVCGRDLPCRYHDSTESKEG